MMFQTLRMSKEGSGGLRCCSDGAWRNVGGRGRMRRGIGKEDGSRPSP